MQADITLYSYWRSSAAYRVRIALNLKGLRYTQVPIHLVKDGGEQHAETYQDINPQGLVPALVHAGHVVTQSLAICEFVDECYGRYPLLPIGRLARAKTRSMALQVACEIHPLNNLRVVKYLKARFGEDTDTTGWMIHWMAEGFTAIEQQLGNQADEPVGGDTEHPGLFECFLVPQVYNAERFGMDLSAYPEICRVTAKCRQLPAFIQAAPERQPDAVSV